MKGAESQHWDSVRLAILEPPRLWFSSSIWQRCFQIIFTNCSRNFCSLLCLPNHGGATEKLQYLPRVLHGFLGILWCSPLSKDVWAEKKGPGQLSRLRWDGQCSQMARPRTEWPVRGLAQVIPPEDMAVLAPRTRFRRTSLHSRLWRT